MTENENPDRDEIAEFNRLEASKNPTERKTSPSAGNGPRRDVAISGKGSAVIIVAVLLLALASLAVMMPVCMAVDGRWPNFIKSWRRRPTFRSISLIANGSLKG